MANEHQIQNQKQAVAEASRGELYEKTLTVTGGATETWDETDFPIARGALTFIQVIGVSGTTDVDVSIHENTSYDNTDKVFQAETVSINDGKPTGGYPASANGLPYEEASGAATLHIQTVENSGTGGDVLLRVRYVEG